MHTNLHNFTRGTAANNPAAIAARLAPLSREQLFRKAPSIFAETAHESRSARYAYVPTFKVLDALESEGFVPVQATQSISKIAGRENFTKHAVTFIRQGATVAAVGDSIAQVRLVNSHDGSSAYKLFAGLYRLACSNGLLVCDGEFDSVSVAHFGDIRGRVIEGSYRVIEEAGRAGERVADWRAVALTHDEQHAFARAAIAVRFQPAEGVAAPLEPAQALRARRGEDTGADLWSTFNRLQENLVRGGQQYRNANGRRARTREVRSIDSDTSLNRALWRLADEMRQLKAA